MKLNFRTFFGAFILGIVLMSCSSQNQSTTPITQILPTNTQVPTEIVTNIPPTESVTNTPEPTLIPTSVSNNSTGTILNFKFPFEPSFPGYLVDIKSKSLAVNLMCILEQGKTTGDAIELNQNSNESKKYGVCDTKSMILDTRIDDEITVTVILGGFPVVNEVTKSSDRTTDQSVEFDFEYSFQ